MTAFKRAMVRLAAWVEHCAMFGEASAAARTVWPTGFAPLDQALEGGLPGGRLTLVQGEAGSGKTSFCLSLVAQLQQAGHGAVWCDTTGTWLASRARTHGVEDTLWVMQEGDVLRALAMATAAVGRGLASVLVLDAWPPGDTPKAWHRALRELGRAAHGRGALVLVVQSTEGDSKCDRAPRYTSATVLKLIPEVRSPSSKVRTVRINMQKCASRHQGLEVPMLSFLVPFSWHAGPKRSPGANIWPHP